MTSNMETTYPGTFLLSGTLRNVANLYEVKGDDGMPMLAIQHESVADNLDVMIDDPTPEELEVVRNVEKLKESMRLARIARNEYEALEWHDPGAAKMVRAMLNVTDFLLKPED